MQVGWYSEPVKGWPPYKNVQPATQTLVTAKSWNQRFKCNPKEDIFNTSHCRRSETLAKFNMSNFSALESALLLKPTSIDSTRPKPRSSSRPQLKTTDSRPSNALLYSKVIFFNVVSDYSFFFVCRSAKLCEVERIASYSLGKQ